MGIPGVDKTSDEMGRSREKGIFEFLAVAPWWLSIIVGVLVYAACKAAPSFLHFSSPLLAAVNILTVVVARNGHWFALPFVIVAGGAAFNRRRRARLLAEQTGIESIRDLSWQDFELLVGEAFRARGYTVDETGGGGADGGVDLCLRRDGKTYLVQCKRWRERQVPVTAVRELLGVVAAEKAAGAYFVCCGSFTPDARQFASETGIVLVDGGELLQLIGKPTGDAVARDVETPSCPTCGGRMVMRTAKRGAKAGERFWGCEGFPRCRGVAPIAQASGSV
jgi:restriction system protein